VKGIADWRGRRTLHSSYLVVRQFPPPFPPLAVPPPSTVRRSPPPDSTLPILALSEKFYSGYYASASRDVGGCRTLFVLRPFCLSTRFPSTHLPPSRPSRTLPLCVLFAAADPLSPLPSPPTGESAVALSPGEKRRKHNIITISKSRFLMSSRGHNVPNPRSFVCHSRCFSRRAVHPLLRSDSGGGKTSNRKTFARFPICRSRMCSRSPALLVNS